MFTQTRDITINAQVTELLRKMPQTAVLDKGRRLLQIPIQGNAALRINISATYPETAPLMTVTQPINHPWVNTEGVVWCDTIKQINFKFDNLALLRLAMMVVNSLGQAQITPGTYKQAAPQARSVNEQTGPATSVSKVPAAKEHYTHLKKELEKLASKELFSLLTDKEAYASFIANQQHLHEMEQSMKDLLSKNKALAQKNIQKQQQIAELKNQIAIIRSTEVPEVREKYNALAEEHNKILTNINIKTLKDKLLQATKDADTLSEDLQQELLSKKIPLEDFVQSYGDQRELFHRRTLVMQTMEH